METLKFSFRRSCLGYPPLWRIQCQPELWKSVEAVPRLLPQGVSRAVEPGSHPLAQDPAVASPVTGCVQPSGPFLLLPSLQTAALPIPGVSLGLEVSAGPLSMTNHDSHTPEYHPLDLGECYPPQHRATHRGTWGMWLVASRRGLRPLGPEPILC